ncbi:OmpA family protein [Mucilaginibacter sp. McL0603]|uniref:OmpA family protein n=1 Tax=Mucilaginibacter sp. McL0603 TaxID=3415670 RepID=UPI003CE84E2A
MKFIRSRFAPIMILFAVITLQACKPKKLIQKSAPPVETPKPAPVDPPKPKPVEATKPAVVPVKNPDLNINEVKIQFEFDSSVLRTSSYSTLDQVASQMKLDPNSTYVLNGYASIEGTKEHNLRLSKDRANAVKTYLVNAGVSANNIKTKGFGTRNPVADNSTEAGKELNRRVEIKTKQ